ncbi:alginate lyase-domain-containing protein [Absidia repens]|uniref:Alginate lyase-domain-containing protein n=1 Tax=Absidia repens TaxID=90262 RepID=A0A1X2IEX1_9FUNG|nr:alginate lyase-domain-containing protein [Absidia repens]
MPRKPEIEYINLAEVAKLSVSSSNDADTDNAIKNVKKLADGALKKGPYTITEGKSLPHIAASGDIHDFLSYAPYWWPSPKNDGKYVRKDGKRNPDVALVKDQSQLEDFSEQLMFLCLGYQIYKNENYANHAIYLLDVFLVNPSTKMNPHVNYGQVVRGTNNPGGLGRAEGIISTRVLARVANVIPMLYGFAGYARISGAITSWFQQYGHWLLTSEIGRAEAATINNHASWYMVQLIMVISTFGLPSTTPSDHLPAPLKDLTCHFLQSTLPQQINMETGDQPLESARTRPFHYLVFNLQALLYITNWSCPYQQILGCQDDMLEKTVSYLVSYDTDAKNEDPTEAVRCVQQMQLRFIHKAERGEGDTDSSQTIIDSYQQFVDKAYRSDMAEKISGPKNSIHYLWSR